MAEYRCVKHQTSRCDMENKKILTPNYLIINKTYQNKNLFYVLALSVSAKTDTEVEKVVDSANLVRRKYSEKPGLAENI